MAGLVVVPAQRPPVEPAEPIGLGSEVAIRSNIPGEDEDLFEVDRFIRATSSRWSARIRSAAVSTFGSSRSPSGRSS